jgi:hypothetical protein
MAWSSATANPPCKRVAETNVKQSISTTFRVSSLNILMFLCTPCGSVPGERSPYRSSLRAGRYGDRMPVEKRFSAPFQTVPGAYPASYTVVPGLFPWGKVAGARRWPPIPSSSKVKERIRLNFYSLPGPPWPVLGWTLPSIPNVGTILLALLYCRFQFAGLGQSRIFLRGVRHFAHCKFGDSTLI